MTNIYSSGNEIVDEVGKIHFTGNIVPTIWNKTIVKDSGKPHWLAINILADIVYWYRPTEIRDEQTGELIGFKKKFQRDLLQRSYQQLADQFAISKRDAQRAIVFLEELGVIKREFRTIIVGGTTLNNVLYLELIVDKLKTLTYPVKTLSPENVIGDSENGKSLSQDFVRPISEIGKTNTKNKTNIITNISDIDYPLQSSNENDRNDVDNFKKEKVLELIRENVEYESLIVSYKHDRERIDGIIDLIADVYLQTSGTVKINGQDKPLEIVKSQFIKINYSHLEYILNSLDENTTKIKNLRNYLLTTIYNAPMTMAQYYQSWASNTLYGDG